MATGIAPLNGSVQNAWIENLRQILNTTLRGKPTVIEQTLTCLLARGHILLEDLPGLGKTTLAKALAKGVGGTFARLQCTPDLLPGDVTGFSIFNQKTREFEFQPGPVFADILLVDEINRATPRTQSALLEAMAERQVTVDNVQHTLSQNFFVIATQNPTDHHGTYPLPEAQLDRFAMKLHIGYPELADEIAMLAADVGSGQKTKGTAMTQTGEELWTLQQEVQEVGVVNAIQTYLVNLAHTIRAHSQARMGLSPRALLIWQRAAQANAYLQGRDFVTPDDVQAVAIPVLGVRMSGDPKSVQRTITEILHEVPVPSYTD